MEPKVQVVERDDDVTETNEYTIDEFIDVGGSPSTVKSLLEAQVYLAEGILDKTVNRNKHVVERALEENVFEADIRVPGWFVANDDELAEHFGNVHPGATVKVRGLTEDYSEKAWRVIAIRETEVPGLIYEYFWTFLPKSVVKLFRLTGIKGFEDADKVSKLLSEIRRRRDTEWAEMSWEEKLAEIDR